METNSERTTENTESKDLFEDTQAEISEIDSGNKETINYDELISFSHTYSNYSICQCFESAEELKEATFGLLLNNEFLLGGNIIFDDKQTMSNKDLINNIKDRVKNFKGSELCQKVSFIENILFFAKQIGLVNTAELILPILLKIYQEKNIVIEKFLTVLPDFAEFLNSFEEKGYMILKEHILPILNEIFYSIEDQKILELASKDLVCLTKYLNDDDKGAVVLTKIIFMAHDEAKDNIRELSVKLFSDLAQVMGGELYTLYVVPQMASFADDQCSKVRKAVATYLINICEIVPHDVFVNRLFSVYEKIAKDSLWNVRKASVEILPKLTKLCDSELISTKLLEIFKGFVNDQKNHVKISALEVFGEFISLIKKDDKDNYNELLEFYIQFISEFKSVKGDNDNKIISKCAYNFPAVLLFWGKDSWDKLKPCYEKMMAEKDEKIRISLSSSLGEISNILGKELTERDLLGYITKYLNSTKEIQVKILGILPTIIKNINNDEKAKTYLDNIKLMIGASEKWRRKLEYAKIIGLYHHTYADDTIYKRVFPIALSLCFDNASKVRMKAAKNISKMILQLVSSSKVEFQEKSLKILKSFANSINYNYRQSFILMCTNCFDDQEVYKKYYAELLLKLAFDKIINVRITLAKFMYKLIKKNKYQWVIKDDTIKKICTILKKDTSLVDVKEYIDGLQQVEILECEEMKNVNDEFIDKMQFLSNEFAISKNVPCNSKI